MIGAIRAIYAKYCEWRKQRSEAAMLDGFAACDEIREFAAKNHPEDHELTRLIDECEAELIHEAVARGMAHAVVMRREEGKAQKATT